ncbi:alpha/beta fold hydrolase [Pseudonocardia kujensis]|uniref:alpha/beta fold hydrolase n=1 Tax=Pseudonocardia kujensis TaxID=1128675 RepID=UPI001E2FD8FE|nr:alpha/beta fold hydrolase [Pseudonocardia kujensis]MCE0768660.1 alpha/beta fold hydrolase [Pseudonocardia kujensis]
MNDPVVTTICGRRTRLRVAGPSDAPTVVLLHGIGRSLEDWGSQFPFLSKAYRTVAVDIAGFGMSERAPGPMDIPALATATVETLDAVDVDPSSPWHVAGNSLGGAVAMGVLAARPERVASLTLVASAGFGREVTPLIRLLAVPGIGNLLANTTTRASALLTERLIFADSSYATGPRIDHAVELARRVDAGPNLHETAHRLIGIRGVRAGWRTELLRAVEEHCRPMLLMWGSRDRILPEHHLRRGRALFPHARTHRFDGAGHMPQIECAGEFADVFMNFLTEAGQSDPLRTSGRTATPDTPPTGG